MLGLDVVGPAVVGLDVAGFVVGFFVGFLVGLDVVGFVVSVFVGD
jgi:hypothetical protein